METLNPHRKFLHDLATPITVVKSTLKKIQNELERAEAEGNDIDRALCTDRIEKAMEALKKMEELHLNYFVFIKEQTG